MDMPDIPADAGGAVPSGGADRQPLKKEGVSALFFSYNMRGDHMKGQNCDPLALTTAINTLAVAIAGQLNDEDLEMTAVILTQLGDTLATISVQRSRCAGGGE